MRAFLALFALPLALACGGGSKAAPGAPTILVQPASASVQAGLTQAFTAAVGHAADASVLWSVLETGGGSITAAGLYTAPAVPGTYHVKAVLAAQPSYAGQATVTVVPVPAQGVPSLGIGAALNGYLPFPGDSPWNQDVSGLPADPASAAIVAFVGAATGLHADFGSGTYQGAPIGIPYAVVAGGQTRVPVAYQAYGGESDPGPMPIPVPPPFEGADPTGTSGDRHVLVLDRDANFIYELYGSQLQPDGSWRADSGAIWDAASGALRPWGWTSADAAGLPLFPGLAKYDELASGAIRHALRLTVPATRKAFVAPATHWASSDTSSGAPPMGTRFRLKAARDISGFPPQSRVILKALKTYGMILADNGSAWYLSGCPDARWDNTDLHALGGITGADLEVVQMGTVYTTVPAGAAPAIQAFTATPAAGGGTTLSWTATGATRAFLTPAPGPVRGASALVKPVATTTYTLLVEGPYGSATAQVTVNAK
ncbi:hypothetical protein [Mesoterricola silvestris]|uniref:Uncharacterized protein n=1 Tax=Mesoterricola silvestris TaxID=2927979 RepID=A0AA48GN77_9BACT|nr:hypothetical protein [Mesoterricola silvestris]BDU72625.1 hypothetical protein METEAL_17990 [Mesoterricola silvestris]